MIFTHKLHVDSVPDIYLEQTLQGLDLWLRFCSLLYGTNSILTLHTLKLSKEM
ncbi:hypothetical protein H6G27_12560 [Nostoc linckia FACHB-104]|nr:hypothetical protein [Nostoc linckia FACHB-104]